MINLINYLKGEDFNYHFSQKKPAHIANILDQEILSWDDINKILSSKYIDFPQLRIVNNNNYYFNGFSGFVSKSLDNNGGIHTKMRKDIIYSMIKDGGTLVIDRCQEFIPNINNICQIFQQYFRCPISANLYYCYQKDSSSFGMHFDDHDVISIQLFGDKKWSISSPTFKNPLPHHKSFHYEKPCENFPEICIHNKINGLVFVPRGYWHLAEATSSSNVHISFAINRPRNIDAIKTILNNLEFREKFRESVSLNDANELDSIINETIEYLKGIDIQYFLNSINSYKNFDATNKFDLLNLR